MAKTRCFLPVQLAAIALSQKLRQQRRSFCRQTEAESLDAKPKDLLAARAKVEHQDSDGQNGLFGAVQSGNKAARGAKTLGLRVEGMGIHAALPIRLLGILFAWQQELLALLIQHKCPLEAHTLRQGSYYSIVRSLL